MVSRKNGFSGPRIQSFIGALNPIFLFRYVISCGMYGFMPSRMTALEKPFRIFAVQGIENAKETSLVISGLEETIKVVTDCVNQTKESIDACFGSKLIVELMSFAPYLELAEEIRKRRLRLRVITSITHENLIYCKDIVRIPRVELRHIDEVHSKFILFDSSRMVSALWTDDSSAAALPRIIYTNIRSQASLYREIFDNLLQLSEPAEQRIRELEAKATNSVLSLVEDPKESMKIRINLFQNAKGSVFSWQDSRRLKVVLVPELREAIKGAINRGVRVRLLCEIKPDNLEACKERIAMGYEVRHISDFTEGTFYANETEYTAPVSNNDDRADRPVVYCSFPLFVKQQASIFEVLWKDAIPALERIREIEGKGSPELKHP